MSPNETTTHKTDRDWASGDGWLIGVSEDNRVGRLGLVARRYSDPRGRDAIRINWRACGDPREIAARLHELANALELEAGDNDGHTFVGPR